MLQSLFLFRVQFLLPRYLSYFDVEGAGHYQERRKVMRTVPVSNVFSLRSHGHQKRQTFRRDKDKTLDKEMVWTLCPQLNFFDAYSDFLWGQHYWRVEETLFATRNAFIFLTHAQRTRSKMESSVTKQGPGWLVSWSSVPLPTMQKQEPPSVFPGPDAAHVENSRGPDT